MPHSLAQPKGQQVKLKHGDFAEKLALARRCQTALIHNKQDWKAARDEMGMHHKVFRHHLDWLNDYDKITPIFDELKDHEHDDVLLMVNKGFGSPTELRQHLISKHLATGKLNRFVGTQDELERLIKLVGLIHVWVGDRVYVHWNETQQEAA
jgi:hypothetical protein